MVASEEGKKTMPKENMRGALHNSSISTHRNGNQSGVRRVLAKTSRFQI
jgi:hypothetical protein